MDFTSQPDGEFQWVLQLKCHFSRYIWLYALVDKSSTEVAQVLRRWLSDNGHPARMCADNGGEFVGDTKDLLDQQLPPIPIINGRARHPQSQGSIEKANATFKERLAALRVERGIPREWVSLLPELQEVTNTTPNRALPRHMTPFEAWFGRKPHWIYPDSLPAGTE